MICLYRHFVLSSRGAGNQLSWGNFRDFVHEMSGAHHSLLLSVSTICPTAHWADGWVRILLLGTRTKTARLQTDV